VGVGSSEEKGYGEAGVFPGSHYRRLLTGFACPSSPAEEIERRRGSGPFRVSDIMDSGGDDVELRTLHVEDALSDSSVEVQEFSDGSLGTDQSADPEASPAKRGPSAVWVNLFGIDDFSGISSMKDEPFGVRAMAVLRFNVSLSWVTLCCTVLGCALVSGVLALPSLRTLRLRPSLTFLLALVHTPQWCGSQRTVET
jgi:hypothetical protein